MYFPPEEKEFSEITSPTEGRQIPLAVNTNAGAGAGAFVNPAFGPE